MFDSTKIPLINLPITLSAPAFNLLFKHYSHLRDLISNYLKFGTLIGCRVRIFKMLVLQ